MTNWLRIPVKSLLLLPVLLASGVPAVLAQLPPNLDARFALHAKDQFTASKAIPNLCPNSADTSIPNYSPNWDGIDCRDYTVVRGTNEFPGPHVFLVLGQADAGGISGASCGIDYALGSGPGNGIDPQFVTFTSCTDGLEFRNNGGNGEFPNPAGGLRITWSTCQTQVVNGNGVHAVLGVFYIYAYSEDVLQLTPNNNLGSGPELAVTACAGGTTNYLAIIDSTLMPMALGRVHFGGDGGMGFTPCGIIPARPTTWGKLKNQYQGQETN